MIVGEKVRLRPIERDGLPRYVRWFADPEVRRHLTIYLPFSLAQEEQWFGSLQGRLQRQETLVLAVETAEGVHIGNIDLNRINWKDRHAELGIAIGEKTFWGPGYGADAVRAVLGLAFHEMNLHRVFLRVDVDNVRGIRCYEKAGLEREGVFRDVVFRESAYCDQYAMSILESEFET